jgi:hypothetical protein
MTRVALGVLGVVWLAVSVAPLTACGRTPTSQLDCSLDRVEELLVILEGIDSGADAEAASSRVADWEAGWGLHDLRTAELESVSGTSYELLIESRRSRSSELRRRLERQIHRLTVDGYLDRYERDMSSALAILPREIAE